MPRGQLSVEQRLRQTISRLKHENALLRERVAFLEKENALLRTQMGDVLVQLEELKRKVFGKKNKKPQVRDDFQNSSDSHGRPAGSYRRSPPAEEDITDTRDFLIENCSTCDTRLEDLKIVVRYQEDILPVSDWHTVLKTAEKDRIATGYCPVCKKRVPAIPIAQSLVTLGKNIKPFVPYLAVVQRMSFEQIKNFLQDIAHFSISDGEISNILEEQSYRLLSQFEHLKETISHELAAHYDETGWKTQRAEQGNHAWVKTGTATKDTIFLLGRSRGKGNAEELQGEHLEQIGISDNYGAYRTLFKKHQLCWAHPARKLRELSESEHLTQEQGMVCLQTYEAFAGIYQELRATLQEPFNRSQRTIIRKKLKTKLQRLTIMTSTDPPKLRRIKQTLRENQERYFTCLMHEGIPPDNNKAERALRHLVLKRKVSFGSKTQKGADVMGILSSVLLSLWWSKPKNFFAEYSKLLLQPPTS